MPLSVFRTNGDGHVEFTVIISFPSLSSPNTAQCSHVTVYTDGMVVGFYTVDTRCTAGIVPLDFCTGRRHFCAAVEEVIITSVQLLSNCMRSLLILSEQAHDDINCM